MALFGVIKPKMWLGPRQLLLYVGLCLCVLLQVCRSKTQLYCPSVCRCDLYEQRNRAICSAQRLISANMEMPSTVELLDLSYNDISSIDADCFKKTVHLLNLTLAYNAIHILHLDAFTTLQRLQSLDLAYNRLEWLDEHLLESNRQLLYLNLEGNKLATLGEQPLLRSVSLRVLNLRNAQINQLSLELLSGLPQLRELNVAQNLLLTLNAAVFYAPRLLTALNVDENPLNCDRALAKVVSGLRQRGVAISMSDCQFAAEHELEAAAETANSQEQLAVSVKFEHMGELLEAEPIAATPQSVMSIWRPLHDDDDDMREEPTNTSLQQVCEGTRERLCQRYMYCVQFMSDALLHEPHDKPDSVNPCANSYDRDDVKVAFVVGAATGVCIVIFIIAFSMCIKGCSELCSKQAQRPRHQQTALPLPADQHQLQTEILLLPPPPPASRVRQPRRSNPQRPGHGHVQTRALVRQPYGPQDNFVSRLFGRPARQQYYRTLNQNTATLIRRLSRSNLFTNRQSEPSSPTTPPASTTHFYADIAAAAARPETPPPNYGDVVVIEHCDSK